MASSSSPTLVQNVSTNIYTEDKFSFSEGICLICNSTNGRGLLEIPLLTSNKAACYPTSSSVLASQLPVYFFLQHVLDLPSELLEKYLRHCPNPERWVKVCEECSTNYLEKCRNIFLELLEVKMRFATARLEVIEAIKKNEVTIKQEEQDIQNFIVDIYSEIRRFVRQREYAGSKCDPFTGDFLASQKLLLEETKTTNSSHIQYPCSQHDAVLPITLSTDAHHLLDADVLECETKQEPVSPMPYGNTEADSEVDHHHHVLGLMEVVSSGFAEEDMESSEPLIEPCVGDNLEEITDGLNILEDAKEPVLPKTKNPKRVSCHLCSKSYPNNTKLLRIHQINSHGVNLFECQKCDEWKTKIESDYRTHLKQHGDVACDICLDSFPSEDLVKRHTEVVHRGKKLECSHCPLMFRQKAQLRVHISRCHSDKREKFSCELCKKVYLSEKSVLNHLSNEHGVKDSQDPTSSNSNEPRDNSLLPKYFPDTYISTTKKVKSTKKGIASSTSTASNQKSKEIECVKCQRKFSSKAALKSHNKAVHGKRKFRCETCNKDYLERPKYVSHMRTVHGEKIAKYECEKCNISYTVQATYLTHLGQVHHQKKYLRYPCHFEGCKQGFYSKELRVSHEGRHKDKEKQHICNICDKVLLTSASLKSHVKNTHENAGQKPFRCDLCPASYKNVFLLRRHMKSEHDPSGVKKIEKIPCPICGKVLSSQLSLRIHTEAVHEKKFEVCCDLCGKIFKGRNSLNKHKVLVHNEGDKNTIYKFSCTVDGCTRRFISTHTRQEHILSVHEGQRLFQCEQCGKNLSSRTHLIRHTKAMHSEDREQKPIKCEICGVGFAVREYLWCHMKTHRNNNAAETEVDYS